MQEAPCGTGSRVSRIAPWAKGRAQPLRHPGSPRKRIKISRRDVIKKKKKKNGTKKVKTFPQIFLLGSYMKRQMDGVGIIRKYKENLAIKKIIANYLLQEKQKMKKEQLNMLQCSAVKSCKHCIFI